MLEYCCVLLTLLPPKFFPGHSVGNKAELVDRLIKGVPVHEFDPLTSIHYGNDPVNPSSVRFFLDCAPTSRTTCSRCTSIIRQGGMRLGCDHGGHAAANAEKHYHPQCFAARPPKGFGINSAADMTFSDPPVTKKTHHRTLGYTAEEAKEISKVTVSPSVKVLKPSP